MKFVIASALALLVASAPASAQVAVRVFTVADPSGLTDAPTRERLKAVEDMKKRLGKNKDVRLVDDDTARVSIEVLSAGWELDGGRSAQVAVPVGNAAVITGGQPTQSLSAKATITSGTFSTQIEASVGPFGRSFGENLARKFEGWIKDNAAALRAP